MGSEGMVTPSGQELVQNPQDQGRASQQPSSTAPPAVPSPRFSPFPFSFWFLLRPKEATRRIVLVLPGSFLNPV